MSIKSSTYKSVTKVISRLTKTPQYIILFVSDSCWMKCRHCWFSEEWKENNLTHKIENHSSDLIANDIGNNSGLFSSAPNSYDRLSFDEIEKIAQSIKYLSFLSLTGGEAFLRKDIVEIIKMLSTTTKLKRYQIPTSGFKTDMIVRKTEKILSSVPNIPFRVDVSLDGTRETHNYIRNIEGGFDQVINTVRELNKLKQKYSNFDVGVITTISHYNQNEIDDIAKIAFEANNYKEWMVNITRGEPRDTSSIKVDPQNYMHAHELIENEINKQNIQGHTGHTGSLWLSAKNAVRRTIIHDMITGDVRGGGCAAGSLSGVIYSDGEVMPCELLEKSIGNIRDFDYNLEKLWNSKKGDDIRDFIQDTECSCTQECNLSTNILIQPRHWPALAKERVRIGRSARIARQKLTTV